jgi:hypothetical protein
VLSLAATVAVHRRTRRGGGHTRSRGNFSGTLIPYASAIRARALALALAHIRVGEILALGVAHGTSTTDRTAVVLAVPLATIASAADPEHR